MLWTLDHTSFITRRYLPSFYTGTYLTQQQKMEYNNSSLLLVTQRLHFLQPNAIGFLVFKVPYFDIKIMVDGIIILQFLLQMTV